MPLANVTSVLATGLLPMFVAETAPSSTKDAAETWAQAYTDYALAGGIPATPKKRAFASALAAAFNPELAGGGPTLFIQALSVFWQGLPVPAQAGVVTGVVPTGGVTSQQPDDASPQQQADGLAAVISSFTLSAVKVTVPPGVVVPIL